LFRLNGFEVTLPPLRERHGEILALARLFLERVGGREGRPALALGPAARDAILAHAWPGNIRELKTTIERGAAVAWHKGERTVEPAHLMIPAASARVVGASKAATNERGSLRRLFASEEKAKVLDALRRARGNQTKAARLLGVSRRTIISKIEAFGIERPRKDSRKS
jgi:transcriptional regulator with PAS, ATPase and Fis domain